VTDEILGVLGGMGPLASAHFMLRLTLLTPAERDQDHIPTVLWSDPRVPDRIAGQRGTGPDPLPWLLRGIRGLRQAGCGAIVIPCNTAHGWFEPMAEAAGVPILHIVEAAATDLLRIGITGGTIGLIGTVPTLAMRLYQDRLGDRGWACLEPDIEQMERLVLPAIALVKVNRLAEAYAPLVEVVNSLASRGASAVVLGCTEVPLGIQAGPSSALRVPVVDTIDALARAAISWAKPVRPCSE
jgi:aspartate racemase